jgi:hypothetical protein
MNDRAAHLCCPAIEPRRLASMLGGAGLNAEPHAGPEEGIDENPVVANI